ncbi:MAG: hypothetical protein KGJ35_03705, partial [Patescibacteria group bacterium]|nr:hypothetical protein [Patescibacteria group bacterium]
STMTLSNANSDNMTNTVDEVKKELSRVSSYWNEHGESGDEIKEIIFCGSKVNEITKALESDKGRETLLSVANVWINAFDLNRYVPTITKTDSLEYAVAAGLALPSHR